jgi:DNA-binding SARP family transcriptional activator
MKQMLVRLGLLGLAVGTPIILGALVGSPMPPDFRGSDLSGSYVPVETVLRLLGLLSWAIWTYLAFAVLLHGAATVASSRGARGQRVLLAASSILTPKLVRSLVEFAIGSAVVATSLSVHASSALPAVRAPAPVEAGPAPSTARVFNHAELIEPTREVYRVRPGDSLWRIAERELGSGLRWREIYRLNEGKQFGDGRSLTNPHLIRSGWVLDLPRERRDPADTGEHERHSDEEHEASNSPPPTRSPRPTSTFESPTEQVEAEPSADVETDESGPSAPAAPAFQIPSGLLVAASFASGLLTAHLLGRLHRRRSRRLSGVAAVRPSDTPELIQNLRRAGASEMAGQLDVAVDAVIEAWRAHTGSWPYLIAAVEEASRHVSVILRESDPALPGSTGGTISPRVRFVQAGPSVIAQVDGPFPVQLRPPRSPLERGVLVPVGRAPGGSVVHVSATGVGWISLAGPGATGLVRQLVVAAATQGGPDDLRLVLLGSGEEMKELCRLPHTSACERWTEASAALRDVELELIRRARLFLREGVEDIHSHLAEHSDEQLPALLVVCEEPPPALRGQIDALAQQAPTLGAAVVALGWTLAGDGLRARVGASVQLDADLPLPKALEPFLLDDRAQREAIEVIREAYPSEPGEELVLGESIKTVEEVPTPTPAAVQVPHGPPRLVAEPERPLSASGEPPEPPPHMLAIRCLGPFEISRAGESISKGWRAKGRELLAYLVAHPAGAPKERIIDELWHDIEPRVGVARFDRCATYVRATARGMEDSRMYVERVGESAYRLDESAWWVDAWEFERLIREAERSDDATEAITSFRDAVAMYRGEFCDDAYYPWLDGIRERFRNLFVEASGRLAYLLTNAEEHDQALSILDQAIQTDPVCEDLVRRAIAVEAALGRRGAALARYRKLEAILDEQLSVEPDPETRGLVQRLMGPRERAG